MILVSRNIKPTRHRSAWNEAHFLFVAQALLIAVSQGVCFNLEGGDFVLASMTSQKRSLGNSMFYLWPNAAPIPLWQHNIVPFINQIKNTPRIRRVMWSLVLLPSTNLHALIGQLYSSNLWWFVSQWSEFSVVHGVSITWFQERHSQNLIQSSSYPLTWSCYMNACA